MRFTHPVTRAPDDRFENLPGFGFAPHFALDLPGFKGLRLHYLDEGPADAPRTFLCLHGNPSWSYLWRKMIPVFTGSGARVVAPDLPGFGRSDQPLDDAVHTFDFHRDVLLAFVRQLDLKHVTLVCQDWGGILGLTLPHAEPARFARLLVMNTTLATGDVALPEGFQAWRAWSNAQDDMDVPRLFARMAPMASADERAAYGASFPDRAHKAALRRFPNMVPDSLDAEGAAVSREAREFWLNEWTGQTFMAIGMQDPVLGPATMPALQQIIRRCPPPLIVGEGGHMLPEWGEDIARAALKAFGDV